MGPLYDLIKAFKELPGVGEKTAVRYAFYVLNADMTTVKALVSAIRAVKAELKLCSSCFNLTDTDPCAVCSDPRRDTGCICVVETPIDLLTVEKGGGFHGLYHVLHGLLAPLDAIGPDDIRVSELLQRVREAEVKEVILALNPTVEGETTATFISDQLRNSGVRTARIAYGIPIGGSLEYTDPLTLTRALQNRTEI
ncbi:MAG: recombination mediator RecR [Pseudomonadota bacterium]